MRLTIFVFLVLSVATPAVGQGSVNVYDWTDYTVTDQLKDFEKQTGIHVNYATYNTNEILDAKLRSGQWDYDVVVPTASPFFAEQVKANLYLKLDRSLLRNWGNLDPTILSVLAKSDPGNLHGIPLTWGTIGIGYNVAEIKKRMPDAPVDSLRMLFDPAVVSKFADCGVTMLDSPTEMLPAALKYLGLDPDSKNPRDITRAANAIRAVRPYIRKFDSISYIYDLGAGDTCLAFGFAGGIFQARERAVKAERKPEIAFVTPREGSLMWIDVAAIPARAPNRANAHRFLDYLMDAKVAAVASEATGYAFANKAAAALLPRHIANDPLIYPTSDVRSRFYTITAGDPAQAREIDRLWTAILKGR